MRKRDHDRIVRDLVARHKAELALARADYEELVETVNRVSARADYLEGQVLFLARENGRLQVERRDLLRKLEVNGEQ